MVHEFIKTLVINYSEELSKKFDENKDLILNFLKSSSHITEFISYYVDQGKLLTKMELELYDQNRKKLDETY